MTTVVWFLIADSDKYFGEQSDKQVEVTMKHGEKNIFRVMVSYDRSVEDAIKAGRYDWVNSNITWKNFSTNRSGLFVDVDIELFHFGKNMTTGEVLAELDKKDMRPVELHELLALGEKFPDLQREFPVIAFGSVCKDPNGSRFCPSLDRVVSFRALNLYWISSGWDGGCRFAAVRK